MVRAFSQRRREFPSLRTGTRFRFGNRNTGRHGKVLLCLVLRRAHCGLRLPKRKTQIREVAAIRAQLQQALREVERFLGWDLRERECLFTVAFDLCEISGLDMKTSVGSLKRALNIRTCFKFKGRRPFRNMETALSEPNSGIKSRCARCCCSSRKRNTETGSASGTR